jgi:tRNA-specific 2-thiouridylase
MGKIAVAMSGGVDSSVAAAILKEQGHEVMGLSMRLWNNNQGNQPCASRCCSLDDLLDAANVARKLDIPHYVVDLKNEFRQKIFTYFLNSYCRGKTPNPCIYCNSQIKFHCLLMFSKEAGFDKIASGHYAQVEFSPQRKRYVIKKGKDRDKDQSYFLFNLSQEQLAQIVFPLGKLRKQEVRSIAEKLSLPVAKKDESQEICFVKNGSYIPFIEFYMTSHLPKPGDIVDLEGNAIGKHKGIHRYTVGQRRGMGVAHKSPLYVINIDAEKNQIIAGPAEQTYNDKLIAEKLNWVSIERLSQPIEVMAKIRYRHSGAKALVYPQKNGLVLVEFKKPQRAITPGQAVVFYQADLLLGGGWITDRKI